jgi:hypothetical protein
MSDQLPPVDPELRRQLTRRCSGSMPAELLRETLRRLDQQPAARRFGFRMPRAVAGFGSVAVVAIVAAVLVLMPSLSRPAGPSLGGYPAERALTTAELAELMSGPALAVNTTFVAAVTIDMRNDVCPMDRAPTIGVIEGTSSQVCAMDPGGGLSSLKSRTLTGTFVFQYWAPGYLGVLGEVTRASSSHLAFRVGDTWPKQGSFLVDAWLHSAHVVGNDPAACPGQTPDQSGSFNCPTYWLSDSESDVSAWRLDVWISSTYSSPKPGHGVFMVNNDGCQDPVSSACSGRVIETRLADNPFPDPSTPTLAPTPAPTARQLEGYPAERALNTAELADLMAGPDLAANTTFVASATIDVNGGVCPMDRAPTIGLVEGMRTQVCVMDLDAGLWPNQAVKLSGIYVFQYWAPGVLAVLAQVRPASSSQLAFQVPDSLPANGQFLVRALLSEITHAGDDPGSCPNQTPDPSGRVSCTTYMLVGRENVARSDFSVAIAAGYEDPEPGWGVFLLSRDRCPGASESICYQLTVHARLTDDPFAAVALPTRTPRPTATPAPTPLVLPTAIGSGAQPVGLWGSGSRPFTVDELPLVFGLDPGHLANRIVIVKGPVPSGLLCTSVEMASPHPARATRPWNWRGSHRRATGR